jgi:hypothetical protein
MVGRRLLSRAVREAATRIAFDPSPTIKHEIARLPSAAEKRVVLFRTKKLLPWRLCVLA